MSVNKSILIEFWALNGGEHGDKQKKQSLIQNRPENLIQIRISSLVSLFKNRQPEVMIDLTITDY